MQTKGSASSTRYLYLYLNPTFCFPFTTPPPTSTKESFINTATNVTLPIIIAVYFVLIKIRRNSKCHRLIRIPTEAIMPREYQVMPDMSARKNVRVSDFQSRMKQIPFRKHTFQTNLMQNHPMLLCNLLSESITPDHR